MVAMLVLGLAFGATAQADERCDVSKALADGADFPQIVEAIRNAFFPPASAARCRALANVLKASAYRRQRAGSRLKDAELPTAANYQAARALLSQDPAIAEELANIEQNHDEPEFVRDMRLAALFAEQHQYAARDYLIAEAQRQMGVQ